MLTANSYKIGAALFLDKRIFQLELGQPVKLEAKRWYKVELHEQHEHRLKAILQDHQMLRENYQFSSKDEAIRFFDEAIKQVIVPGKFQCNVCTIPCETVSTLMEHKRNFQHGSQKTHTYTPLN